MNKDPNTFDLPEPIQEIVEARDKLRDHYRKLLATRSSTASLTFTIDGKLVGDIGEAIAVELYDVKLIGQNSVPGIDGYGSDGTKTVQIKATGTRGRISFSQGHGADHLLIFDLDFERLKGEVVFNGPESLVRATFPPEFNRPPPTRDDKMAARTRELSTLRVLDEQVANEERLRRIT